MMLLPAPRRAAVASLGVLGMALLPALAGCSSGSKGEPRATTRATGTSDAPATSIRKPVALVLLSDNRVVKISLRGGESIADARIGPRPPRRPAARHTAEGGVVTLAHLLALAADGKTAFALVRADRGRSARVAVVDAARLELRSTYPLEPGVYYQGLLVGASGTLYAYGDRRARNGWSVVVTTGDARTGARLRTATVRGTERQPGVYWGAISPDERRLVLNYHGGPDGADWFRVSPGRIERCKPPHRRLGPAGANGRCIWSRFGRGHVHGAVVPFGDGFLAATGASRIIKIDRDGQAVGEWDTRAEDVHLMTFALDVDGSGLAVSSCERLVDAGINRVDLARRRVQVVPRRGPCSEQVLAVHGTRALLARVPVRRGRGWRLALVDLRDGGTVREVPVGAEPVASEAVSAQR